MSEARSGPRCRVPRGDGADSLEGRDTEGRHVIGERNALEVCVGLEGVGLIAPVERMEAPADGLVGVLGGLVVGEDRGGAVIGRAGRVSHGEDARAGSPSLSTSGHSRCVSASTSRHSFEGTASSEPPVAFPAL